jgi:hypothetical protein
MNHKTVLSLALALALVGNVDAKRITSDLAFERDAADQIPATLVSSKAALAPGQTLEALPVRFSWVLPADQKIAMQEPFVRESREYWTRVPAAELAKGMQIHLTARGSLVRLSPVSDTPRPASRSPPTTSRSAAPARSSPAAPRWRTRPTTSSSRPPVPTSPMARSPSS